MRKALISLLVVLCLFAGVFASAALLIDGERLRHAAIDYIERRDGVQLEIERVERTIGWSPRIEVRGLKLRQPEYPDSPLLDIEYAAFNLDLLSLLFQPVALHDVVVESPMVVLPVADEGLLYWGPAIADLIERLRRFDWALHGFSIVGLEVEALHTVRDARVLLTAASIEGAMSAVSDLTLRIRELGGDLQVALPVPIDGTVIIDELRLQHADAALPVTLEADGHVGSRPLSLRARSGNLLKGDSTTRNAVDATLELGASMLHVNGTASRGAQPHFDLEFALDVQDLASLPSSNVRFRLSDDEHAWDVSNISAAFGDAMASGGLRLERRDPRPLLSGALRFAGFELGSTNTSGSQRSASNELLRLAIERLDRLDATVQLEGEDLKLFGVPVARVRADAELADGRLEIAPVDAEILAGAADAYLVLANHGEPPRFELTTTFGGVETSELATALGIEEEVFGELQGNLELSSAALDSITDGAAGSATLLMSGGRLSAALAHLVDMDFADRILGTFKKRGETTTDSPRDRGLRRPERYLRVAGADRRHG